MDLHLKERARYLLLQCGRYVLLPFSATRRKEWQRLKKEIRNLHPKDKNNPTFLNIDQAYDVEYFESTPFKEEQKYAEAISGVVFKVFSPKSVVDVGCGKGLFLNYFFKKHIPIKGYEGSSSAIKLSVIPKQHIEKADLRRPIKTTRHFHIAISWEVAEHIEKEFVGIYLKNLTDLSDTIVFTAAEPFWNPAHPHHPNEQFPQYWEELFGFYGYKLDHLLTKNLQLEIKNLELPYRLAHYSKMSVYTKQQDSLKRKRS